MDQSSLGRQEIHNTPSYEGTDLARVIDTTDFDKFGIIDVVLLDGSNPSRVWVTNNIDREPVDGDMVLIGYIAGRKNSPYLLGFLDDSYMRNFVQIKKDLIRLQLPLFDIGVIGGESHEDTKSNLLDDSHRDNRAMIELTPEHLLIQFPTAPGSPPSYLKMTLDGKIIVQSRANTSLDPELGGRTVLSNGAVVVRVGDSDSHGDTNT